MTKKMQITETATNIDLYLLTKKQELNLENSRIPNIIPTNIKGKTHV